jgi:hypothetical protein
VALGANVKRSPIRRKTPLRSNRHEPNVEQEAKPYVRPTVQSLHCGVYGGTTSGPAPKKPKASGKAAELRHKAALIELGCMVCRRLFPQLPPGPVELHHLRGGGWGKGDYTTLMPLCPEHHRGPSGVHGLGTKGFPKHYGFDQSDLLADVKRALEQQGAS